MSNKNEIYDVLVVGAGVAGIYQIKRLLDLGLNAKVLEADDDLGGTWYRNRYPGARFDSESYTYGYSFSQEVLSEWHWKERFSSQPENLRYLNFVADRLDLRRHMVFNSRVDSMAWSEENRFWTLTLTNGTTYVTRFVITGVGVLSMPTLPNIDGIDTFKGEAFHTYWWPQNPVSLEGKRVGIIGTGATGIQVIAEIADKVGDLTVFQRRPNWSVPLNNSVISEAEMADIRARYDEIFATCNDSQGGFDHLPDKRGFYNVSKEERYALYDELYDDRHGFALLIANFAETYLDEAANKELSDYVANRTRGRVDDPEVAEKLIPKDHGFGMQRLPLETRYFEAYNRDNVHLVDLAESPIVQITESGIETTTNKYDLDLIIYATGFDAITGALMRIDIQGANDSSLGSKWKDGPQTYQGVLSHEFPNLLMVAGPQSVSGSTNYPRAIEAGVDWVTELLQYAIKNGHTRFEVEAEAEAAWQKEVIRAQNRMPFGKTKSWFTGYNSNLEGHAAGQIHYHAYWGGAPRYRKFLDEATINDYPKIQFS